MLIIADSRMPLAAKDSLSGLGEVLWLEPQPCVYPAIAAHPDIYLCRHKHQLIASPDIPVHWSARIRSAGIALSFGQQRLGEKYPQTAGYNAVFAGDLLIHNLKVSDPMLLSLASDTIHVKQAYTRCNLLALNNTHMITSDRGIEKTLLRHGKNVLFVEPKQIRLAQHTHGFFGGACGLFGTNLVVCGNISTLGESEALHDFAHSCGFTLLSLFDGPLTDVGSMLFFTGGD